MKPPRQLTTTDGTTSTENTMRAIVQDTYGSADVLRLAHIAAPEIGDNMVLVRVRAAGLDRGTWHLMTGRPYLQRLVLGFRRPRNPVPGRDVAGTVVAVGSGVTKFSTGDEVFGIGPGSFAEYTVAREDRLARKPVNTTFEQAAVVPVSGMTALRALCDVGRVATGQKVLVVGASGGVGSYAVQLAKAFGAEVTGVASTGKLDLIRSFGADHVIDYTREDFADGTERYDLILDIAGNPTLVPTTPRAHAHRNSGDRRGRRRRQPDRGHEPTIPGPGLVPVRGPAADHAHTQGGRQRPGTAHRTHRGRQGDAEHRPNLPARARAGGHAPPRSRKGTRKDRHQHLTPQVTSPATRRNTSPPHVLSTLSTHSPPCPGADPLPAATARVQPGRPSA